jgi:hypothetical protein
MDAQTLAEVVGWLDRYSAASGALRARTVAAVSRLWLRFDGWYAPALVAALAAQSADLSETSRATAAGLSAQYAATVAAPMTSSPVQTASVALGAARGGADMLKVYSRPAKVYRRAVSLLGGDEQARRLALLRLGQLMQADLMLAARDAQQAQLSALGVERFRRVLRPELSAGGSCGLCAVASDRVYKVETLMPIHDGCNCVTLPIIGDDDPGHSLNREDLDRLYAAAGSTARADLRRIRVRVSEHGELGPVLTDASHDHRGPGDLPD